MCSTIKLHKMSSKVATGNKIYLIVSPSQQYRSDHVLSNVRSHQPSENKENALTSCPIDRLRGLASSWLLCRTAQVLKVHS